MTTCDSCTWNDDVVQHKALKLQCSKFGEKPTEKSETGNKLNEDSCKFGQI